MNWCLCAYTAAMNVVHALLLCVICMPLQKYIWEKTIRLSLWVHFNGYLRSNLPTQKSYHLAVDLRPLRLKNFFFLARDRSSHWWLTRSGRGTWPASPGSRHQLLEWPPINKFFCNCRRQLRSHVAGYTDGCGGGWGDFFLIWVALAISLPQYPGTHDTYLRRIVYICQTSSPSFRRLWSEIYY